MGSAAAILLTGVFGVGKSTIAEEIADILEAAGTPYAAIDLDWLAWSNASGADHDEYAILARNLAAVAATYREAGVARFVLAGSVLDGQALEAIRAAVAVPLRVIRITAPIERVAERLGSAPTRGRADDLAMAREWLANGIGVGLEEASVENDGAVRRTAELVLELVGWSTG